MRPLPDFVTCGHCGETWPLTARPYPLANGICHDCRRQLKKPNYMLAAENERLKAEVVGAYAERNAVVLAFARLAVMWGWTVGVIHDPAEPDWPVLTIDTHAGQVSWHFKRDELPTGEFDAYPGEWDGHTTPEKYARLARIGDPNAR